MTAIQHTSIGPAEPAQAPPSVGAHYMHEGATYLSVGTDCAEDWIHVAGSLPRHEGVADVDPATMVLQREWRDIYIENWAGEDFVGEITVVLPNWEKKPHGLRFEFATDGVPMLVKLDFSELKAPEGQTMMYRGLSMLDQAPFTWSVAGPLLEISLSVSATLTLDFFDRSENELSAFFKLTELPTMQNMTHSTLV
ncbi:MAG: hypothetical protein Q7J46_14205 [Pseudomonas sp.]|nr:hypothetical protein [Pseudomonas sp.]